jgi:hypothetical protein
MTPRPSTPRCRRFSSANAMPMKPAVTDAVRVPPSPSSTSQSTVTVRGPI